ncbi:hypothetical protein MTR67_004284 [Solanum verrucosum]|uniref:Uncharacterized protein n=1 Tax=Solanum verrucosum TaxID=315347 RepID=A0AAF0TAF0_SOLVR|nr:hypothetical protein MTR67_004284 [Solanum verrucosum]
MDSGGTNFDMSWAPLLAPVDAPALSEIPLLVPSTIPSGTNFERPRAPLLVPNVPSLSSSQRYLPTTMACLMPSPMITPPMSNLVFPPTTPQIDPLIDILFIGASVPMDNNVNVLFGIPRSPSFSELLSLNDDEIMPLLDDTSFDIHV